MNEKVESNLSQANEISEISISNLLGLGLNKLNLFFKYESPDLKTKCNVITKYLPGFIKWMRKAQYNSSYIQTLYRFIERRFKIYLPWKKIKNIKEEIELSENNKLELTNDEINRKKTILGIYYDLNKIITKLKDIIENKNINNIKFTSLSELVMLIGYDGFDYKEFENYKPLGINLTESWLENSYINQNLIYKICFNLGHYYLKAAENELLNVGNLKLAKYLISAINRVSGDIFTLIKIFMQINISYFYSLKKIGKQIENKLEEEWQTHEKEYPGSMDPLHNYRILIEHLLINLYKNTIIISNSLISKNEIPYDSKLLKFSFMAGFLIRTYPQKLLEKLSEDKYYNLNIPHEDYTKLLYDVGKLLRIAIEYEIQELETYSYHKIISNYKQVDNKVLDFLNYILKIKIFECLNKVNKFIKSDLQDESLNSPYMYDELDLTQRIILQYIKNYLIKNNKNKFSSIMSFMLGFSLKKIEKIK